MFKHYFEQVNGIGLFPSISLAIFFLFFVSLIIWVVKADKHYIQTMEHLPIQDDAPQHNSDTQ
jgi:hypothetical protein